MSAPFAKAALVDNIEPCCQATPWAGPCRPHCAAHATFERPLRSGSDRCDAPATAPLDNPKPRAEVTPRAPERYKVQFTVSRETYQKLREAQDLLRRRIPNGDVAAIFDRALTLLLAELHRTRHAATPRPRTTSNAASHVRHIPAFVKREVSARDGGQCAIVGAAGRCTERGFLEYHHLVPFADRGATSVDNPQLRCRAHNAYEAERWFGVREEDLVRERTDAWDASGESSNCLRLR